MVLSLLEFAGTFAVTFGLFVVLARKRQAIREAKQELLATQARQQQLAEAKSNDMWRANKHLRMP